MKKSQLRQIIKEEIQKEIFGFKRSKKDSKIEQVKQEIDNATISNLFYQPSDTQMRNEDFSEAERVLITKLKRELPTLVKLKPNLINNPGVTYARLDSPRSGMIQGVVLGSLNPYMGYTSDNGIINNEKSKASLKDLAQDIETRWNPT